MSKSRLINTKFWDDSYTANLDPIEKLLFIYFLTNPLTNLIGIYEIELKRIAFDTGIDKEMVIKILERFQRDEKIYYFENYIVIKNFSKYQNQGSPKIKAGMEREISKLPENLKKFKSELLKGIDTVSHFNLNSNSNSNLNSNLNSNFNLNSNLNKDTANFSNLPSDFLKKPTDLRKDLVSSCHNEAIKLFDRFYLSRKEIKFDWTGKEIKANQLLLTKIAKQLQSSGKELNKTNLINAFEYVVTHAIDLDSFFNDNYSLSLINSKFNEIVSQLKNGSARKQNSKGFQITNELKQWIKA